MRSSAPVHIVRVLSAIAWLATALMTLRAITTFGVSGVGGIFFGDFAHPWRAQFNLDFGFHLILMAAWVAWRETGILKRMAFGLACIFLGGLFSFAYIFAATFHSNGDVRRLLAGPNHSPDQGRST